MKTEYKHLIFLLDGLDREKKKLVYLCGNKSGEDLGRVEWYGPWKQYCFVDTCNGIYSQSCMNDIANFLSQLNVSKKAIT
jgi:hypothetical protein